MFPNTQICIRSYLPIFRSLFDGHHEGVLIADMDSIIVYYNDAQSRIDDTSPKNALGRKICEVYNIQEDCSPTLHVLRTGHTTFDDVHFYRTRYGKLVNSSCHIYPLLLEGAQCGALSFIQEYSFLETETIEPPAKTPIMALSGRSKGIKELEETLKARPVINFSSIVGKSKKLLELIETAKLASQTPSPIMLVGETGVGKEVFARSIHNHSSCRDNPYTAINCAAVPETLLEGILFGTTKGAFTGAVDKAGLMENANGGTVFLDEVDSMPMGLQNKLLRVLQEFRVRRVGDLHERSINVKIISSVSRLPSDCIARGVLRQDFYYRLGVVQLILPPLRERRGDLPLLVNHFITKHSRLMRITPPRMSPEVMAEFYCYNWPGNVRELEHVIEASLNILGEESSLKMEHVQRVCPDFFSHIMEGTSDKYYGNLEQRYKDVPITVRGSAYRGISSHVAFGIPEVFKLSASTIETFTHVAKTLINSRHSKAVPVETPLTKSADPVDEVRVANEENGQNKEFHKENIQGQEKKDLTPKLTTVENKEHVTKTLNQKTQELEIEHIRKSLMLSGGNKACASRLLGMSPQLLHYKLKIYQIHAKDYIPKSI